MRIERWSDQTIKIGFGLLFALVPLLLTPWNYELFEYNKMMAVYGLTVIIVGAWAMKMIAQKEIRIVRTPLDIPIAIFVASQFVSSIFSIDPHVSWFGYYSRFNGGMLSIISYTLLYWAYTSNMTDKTNTTNMLKLTLCSAIIISLYGVAEHFGIDKHLWVQDVQNRVFSTLGQPNWLAAYLVALLPLGMALALKYQISNSKYQINKPLLYWSLVIGHWSLVILFFLVLLFTRSRSGLLGFAVADAIFWLILFWKTRGFKRFGLPFFILHFAFCIAVFLNGTHIASLDRWFTLTAWKDRILLSKPASDLSVEVSAAPTTTLLEYGGTESGKIRNFVWQGALNAWRSSSKTFFIGTGTETFAFAFFRHKPVGHNLTSEWDFLYNKAHNEYLNYLATTGILGLGSYLFLIGSFTVWFIKCQMSKLKAQINVKAQSSKPSALDLGFDLKFDIWILTLALFAGWLSILVTNFFGFSVVITNLFLFLFPAMIFVLSRSPNLQSPIPLHLNRRISSLSILLVLLVLLVLLTKNWYADTLFASGYRWSHAAEFPMAYPLLKRAAELNRDEPLYHDEYAATLAGLAVAAFEKKEASAGTELVRQSLAESDSALSTSPNNVNFWKTRTKIFYSYANLDPQWNKAAIEALTKAGQLAPSDPKIFYNLAILYGRQADNQKAIELLQKTIELKANYRDAYYALWVFYTETKQPEKAREVLQGYLTKVDPNDKDFQERLKQ